MHPGGTQEPFLVSSSSESATQLHVNVLHSLLGDIDRRSFWVASFEALRVGFRLQHVKPLRKMRRHVDDSRPVLFCENTICAVIGGDDLVEMIFR